MRWIATLLIVALGVALAIAQVGVPNPARADIAPAAARMVAWGSGPFVIAAIIGWFWRTARDHARINGIALAVVISGIALTWRGLPSLSFAP
jgi:hypothetical protein